MATNVNEPNGQKDEMNLEGLTTRLQELEELVQHQAEETERISGQVTSIADMIGATNDIQLVKGYMQACIALFKTKDASNVEPPCEVFYDQETEALCKETYFHVLDLVNAANQLIQTVKAKSDAYRCNVKKDE